MPLDENPTGVDYLKTYQSLFQIIELVVLLVTWCLVASQKFYKHNELTFALGALIFIWLVTM